MILYSPCKRYLLALLLQGKGVAWVEEHCVSLRLDYVSVQFLIYLAENFRPPDVFRPRDPDHIESQEFLALHGLQGLVPRFNDVALRAFQLMQRPSAREVIEVMGLARCTDLDISKILAERKIKAGPDVVQMARHLFWDVDSLDVVQIRSILHLRGTGTEQLERQVRALEDAGAGTGAAATANPLPTPYHLPVNREIPDMECLRVRTRRLNGNQGLLGELHRSMPLTQQLQEATALKKAGYTDPRLVIATLPPSPLTYFLARSAIGLPLNRLDLQKAFEQLQVLLFNRAVEHTQSGHPEAATRTNITLSSFRTIQAILKDLGSADTDLRKRLGAIALQTQPSGHRGHPDEITQGQHRIDPYLAKDKEAATEGVKGAAAAQVQTQFAPNTTTRVPEGSHAR